MDLSSGKKLLSNMSVASLLGSWKHICSGHLPGEPPPDKSKFLLPASEYLALIGLLQKALGKDKGATSVGIYSDANDSSTAIIIATFEDVVGKDGQAETAEDCKFILSALMADKGNATKTIYKSAYPIKTIKTNRYSLLG